MRSFAARFPELRRLQDQIEAAFRETARGPAAAESWRPAVDVYEEEDSYGVVYEVPGAEAKELELVIEERSLTLQGEQSTAAAGGTLRRERKQGRFAVVVRLPGEVEAEQVEAKLSRGLLVVRLGKRRGGERKTVVIEELED
jgi:HSP20 family protein